MTILSQTASVYLQHLPLYRALDSHALRRIVAGTTEIDVPRGTILLRRGDHCCGIYEVAQGRVKLSIETQSGDEKVMSLLGPRTRFGDILIYTGEHCLVTIEALVDTKILYVAKEVVLKEIKANAAFAQSIIEDLSRRLYQRTKEIESYTLLSGTGRFIDYLLSEEPESAVNGARHVMLSEKKGVIASRLNLTAEHFSRILHDLATRDLIQLNGAHVVIPDVGRLHGARL